MFIYFQAELIRRSFRLMWRFYFLTKVAKHGNFSSKRALDPMTFFIFTKRVSGYSIDVAVSLMTI